MIVNPNTLQQVYYDNVRDNQIGGETDGISPEMAHDLGYTDPADAPRILDQAETTRRMALREDIIDETEPKSATLGGAALSTETSKPRELTSAEQNANERRHIAVHRARVPKQVLPGQYS